jgi:hypothetical protein
MMGTNSRPELVVDMGRTAVFAITGTAVVDAYIAVVGVLTVVLFTRSVLADRRRMAAERGSLRRATAEGTSKGTDWWFVGGRLARKRWPYSKGFVVHVDAGAVRVRVVGSFGPPAASISASDPYTFVFPDHPHRSLAARLTQLSGGGPVVEETVRGVILLFRNDRHLDEFRCALRGAGFTGF